MKKVLKFEKSDFDSNYVGTDLHTCKYKKQSSTPDLNSNCMNYAITILQDIVKNMDQYYSDSFKYLLQIMILVHRLIIQSPIDFTLYENLVTIFTSIQNTIAQSINIDKNKLSPVIFIPLDDDRILKLLNMVEHHGISVKEDPENSIENNISNKDSLLMNIYLIRLYHKITKLIKFYQYMILEFPKGLFRRDTKHIYYEGLNYYIIRQLYDIYYELSKFVANTSGNQDNYLLFSKQNIDIRIDSISSRYTHTLETYYHPHPDDSINSSINYHSESNPGKPNHKLITELYFIHSSMNNNIENVIDHLDNFSTIIKKKKLLSPEEIERLYFILNSIYLIFNGEKKRNTKLSTLYTIYELDLHFNEMQSPKCNRFDRI